MIVPDAGVVDVAHVSERLRYLSQVAVADEFRAFVFFLRFQGCSEVFFANILVVRRFSFPFAREAPRDPGKFGERPET